MKQLFLRDVGDGLNMYITNENNNDLAVDFGGDSNLECYRFFNNNFLLSHFHSDHYNGILNCLNTPSYWRLDNFYYPLMPAFEENVLFFQYLLAINIRVSNNHPLQDTIHKAIIDLNCKPLEFTPLSKGDIFLCGKCKYEVLWPPKELNQRHILKEIQTAIEKFNEAKQNDTELNAIYERVNKRYPSVDIKPMQEENSETEYSKISNMKDISPKVQEANDSLRKAANRLSIAFRQEDNLLFLGDLEQREIKSVITNLSLNNNLNYDVLISAHHGTHWDNCLNSVNTQICLASTGSKMQKHIKYGYKKISDKFLRTDEWGDIFIKRKISIR